MTIFDVLIVTLYCILFGLYGIVCLIDYEDLVITYALVFIVVMTISIYGVSITSKKIMLYETLKEIQLRLISVHEKLLKVAENDYDELFSKGNTIRRILEFALKHYCVWSNIPIEIESKYGHIELGKLKKALKENEIDIPQTTINTANELSHDSGVHFSKDDIISFYKNSFSLVTEISKIIHKDPYHFNSL